MIFCSREFMSFDGVVPFVMNSQSCSPLAQTHPSGNSGKSLISTCTGSGYFFCQSLDGVFLCSLNLASCLASSGHGVR